MVLAVINCMPECPDFLSGSMALREEGSEKWGQRRGGLEPLIRGNLTRSAGRLKG